MDDSTRILVQRAQSHDPSATGELFERYRDRMRRALGRMLGAAATLREMDSEDAVQDAILVALRGLEKFEYRGEGSFLAWLLQTARREVLQRLRAARTQKRDAGAVGELEGAAEPIDPAASPSQIARGEELEQRLQSCLERMPAREREVLVLRRYLDASADEIQVELGLPTAGAVRALLSRAQARLAEMLDEPPPS